MCYLLLPSAAFILVLWSTVSVWVAVFSSDWWVSPEGGLGIASNCAQTTTLDSPMSLGGLNSLDQSHSSPNVLSMTFCQNFKWSYLEGPIEEAMAGLCFVAGGIGVIVLLLIILEVLFRWCFKPHPVVPIIAAVLTFCQFIAIAAICIMFAGHYRFETPEGFSIGVSFYIMMISCATSFVAPFLLGFGAISEKKRYQRRFKNQNQTQESSTGQSVVSVDSLQFSSQSPGKK